MSKLLADLAAEKDSGYFSPEVKVFSDGEDEGLQADEFEQWLTDTAQITSDTPRAPGKHIQSKEDDWIQSIEDVSNGDLFSTKADDGCPIPWNPKYVI